MYLEGRYTLYVEGSESDNITGFGLLGSILD